MTRDYKSTYRKNRSRKPLSLQDCRLRLTDCVKEMERIILDDGYDAKKINQKTQAVYAMSNAIQKYVKVTEVSELQKEIEEIKEIVSKNNTNA